MTNINFNELYPAILAIFAAGAAGLVGAFALMKKTVLAGDVISHLAIPGLGLAIIVKIHPLLGAASTLILGSLLIWKLEKRASLSTEAAIGVIFAASVALGALLLNSGEELIDALFGDVKNISTIESIIGITTSLIAIFILWAMRHKLILSLFSPDLAAATKINISLVNLLFLVAFALTILSGLKFLGALLAGALIIIPASAAKQLTHNLNKFLIISAILSIVSVLIGFFISLNYELEFGPIVITIAALIFFLSLLKRKK